MRVIIDLIKYLSMNKKLWLLPAILTIIILGGLIVLSQGSVVAPFLYTLF